MGTWCAVGLIPTADPRDRASGQVEDTVALPTDLGNGVQLVAIPAALKEATNGLGLSWEQTWSLLGQPKAALIRQFVASEPNQPRPDTGKLQGETEQSYNADLLRYANLAVWLPCPEETFAIRRMLDRT